MKPMRTVQAMHVVRRERHGSSSPVVVETTDGLWFTKLRGAAQGIPALIAELIVAELADRLSLAVPARAMVTLPPRVPSADVSDELRDLLDASVGVNVGFEFLEAARNLTRPEYERVPLEVAASVLWLDVLVQNLDRSPSNPNIMVRRGTYWLIDHGAALPFHHDWSAVREDSAHRPYDIAGHVFGWAEPVLSAAHEMLMPRCARADLDAVVAVVPETLLDVFGGDVARRRAMYVSYLWKRLHWMAATLDTR
ncbi:MAG: hypothetical protein IPP90_22960 [Gemmatimonadaceae bacterium]|nr:hypothetical protein [Gemmatimonadaceae bacterium]